MFWCCLSLTAFAQSGERSAFPHPHILVGPGDRTAVLEKIRIQPWAKRSYEALRREVDPYVSRHRNDPEWILSRYLMNRVPGSVSRCSSIVLDVSYGTISSSEGMRYP